MITITVDYKGLQQAKRKLVLAMRDLEDRTKPHRTIKTKQVQRWRRNYASQGGEYGGWAGLAAATIEQRQSMGFSSGPILRRTGGTYTSAMAQADAGQVSADRIDWTMRNTGGGVRGGAYPLSHHTGYPNPIAGRAAIPARPIWPLDGQDEDRAEEILEQYVDMVIAKYF